MTIIGTNRSGRPMTDVMARHGTYSAVAIQLKRHSMKITAPSPRTPTLNRRSRYS